MIRQPAAAAFQANSIDGATLALATTTFGHVLLAKHRLHHGWTWTWPDIACIFLCCSQVRERTIILSKLRFQVFDKGLAGHTLVIAGCSGDMLVDDFVELVAMREGVPVACFHLVGAGSKGLRLGTTSS